jgi:hypothetical protein
LLVHKATCSGYEENVSRFWAARSPPSVAVTLKFRLIIKYGPCRDFIFELLPLFRPRDGGCKSFNLLGHHFV